jgi:hypothetical protein
MLRTLWRGTKYQFDSLSFDLSNPQSTALEASTLTITPPMRLFLIEDRTKYNLMFVHLFIVLKNIVFPVILCINGIW